MRSTIELKNMIFFANHGVSKQETTVGNDFSVTVRFSANLSGACVSDNLDDTVSYAEIYDLVKDEMAKPSQLLENAAYRILTKMKEAFPQIGQIEVQVAKMHPPLGGQMDHAAAIVAE